MATTNFFRQMASLNFEGNVCLTIAKAGENNLVVSLMVQNDRCEDKAKQLIEPLLFRGDALKIDEAFFEDFKSPIEVTSELLSNMGSYMKSVEEVRKASELEKSKSNKPNTGQSGKANKYEEAMAKADELDRENRPRDAWMVLDKLQGYPEHAESIRKRKRELSDKFSASGLFATTESNELPEPSQDEDQDEIEFELDSDNFGEDETEEY